MSIALMTAAFKSKAPSTQKLVLLALCDCANDQGECYPAIETLAEKCSLSERATQIAITEMEHTGYLRRELRRGRSTVYWLTPAAGAPRRICTPHHVHPITPAADAPLGCITCTPQDMHPAGYAPAPAPRAPITITQPSEEPKTKTPPAAPTPPDVAVWLPPVSKSLTPWMAIADLVKDSITVEVATEWLNHRRTRKAKLTAMAWAGFKREADKAGWPYEQAVLKAIARNWTSFEAAWVATERTGAASGETAYQRSMREKYEKVAPQVAARPPNYRAKPVIFDFEVEDVTPKRLG